MRSIQLDTLRNRVRVAIAALHEVEPIDCLARQRMIVQGCPTLYQRWKEDGQRILEGCLLLC
jgi:hypothetical protein